MAGIAGAELSLLARCLDFKSTVTCCPPPPRLPWAPPPPWGRRHRKVFLTLQSQQQSIASRSQDALTAPAGEQTLMTGPPRPETRHRGAERGDRVPLPWPPSCASARTASSHSNGDAPCGQTA